MPVRAGQGAAGAAGGDLSAASARAPGRRIGTSNHTGPRDVTPDLAGSAPRAPRGLLERPGRV